VVIVVDEKVQFFFPKPIVKSITLSLDYDSMIFPSFPTLGGAAIGNCKWVVSS